MPDNITIAHAHTWHCKKMRRWGELFNESAALSLCPFWPAYIINMCGYDYRKGQDSGLCSIFPRHQNRH